MGEIFFLLKVNIKKKIKLILKFLVMVIAYTTKEGQYHFIIVPS
jgi:hypothetical protein